MSALLTDESRAAYTASFGDHLATVQSSPPWLLAIRQRAFDAFLDRGWPTSKQEAWRFTDASPLVDNPLLPGGTAAPRPHFDDAVLALADLGHAVRFTDGAHRDAGGAPLSGVRLQTLAAALRGASRRLGDDLGRHLHAEDTFTALNTAFMSDGALLEIPADLALETPIVLVYLASAEGGASFPRTLVRAGARSRATVIELHLGADGRATLSNAVAEVVLEAGASLAFHTVVEPSAVGQHVGHLAVTQAAGSTFAAQSLVLGGRLVRREAHVVLAGEGSTARLEGLSLAGGDGHVDHQNTIDHQAPGCTSRESYRGAVAGRGQVIWSGHAVVRPGAQGTDARQNSRNLLLSDGAVAHAKPHLEIFANEVKCSHGATTGRLDPEALFYLRARGLTEPDARRVLLEAFLRDGLGAVSERAVREAVESLVAIAASALLAEGASS